MKKIGFLLPVVILAALLSGCPAPQGADESLGSLTITLPPTRMQSSKTPDPTVVASYDVEGAGPAEASFQRLGVAAGTLTITGLVPGEWGVTVSGNNTEGAHVASGTVTVTVKAGETASKEVIVDPVTGAGSLAVTVKWPPGQLKEASLKGTITPRGGSPTGVLLDVENGSASGSGSFAAGYYTVSLSLMDGSLVVCGGAVAIHISTDSETAVTFAFTPSAGSTGRVSITVVPELADDLGLTLTAEHTVLKYGTDMKVTAGLSGGKARSYQWYLNGALLDGRGGPSLILGRALPAGSYRLDLVVSTDSALSSENVLFAVVVSP